MKNLKTYEAFLNISLRRLEDKDLIKLISIDRNALEDLLIEFEDKLKDIHISIGFSNFGSGTFIRPIHNIKWIDNQPYHVPYDGNSHKIDILMLIIRFYPSKKLMEELKQNIKTTDNWYDLIVGDIDLSEEISQLKKRLEFFGFYNIRSSELDTKAKLLINDIYLSDDIHRGKEFLQIDALKNINSN